MVKIEMEVEEAQALLIQLTLNAPEVRAPQTRNYREGLRKLQQAIIDNNPLERKPK